MSDAGAPTDDLARVQAAETRCRDVLGSLTDADSRRASLLPGWTVGHLVTHLARNADSHRRRADAARRGEVIDQYPGGLAARAAEIDAGAGRPAVELRDDASHAADAMQAAWRDVPPAAWANVTRDVSGRERPLHALPARRWQELEVHLVDADLGVTPHDWSDDFVTVFLPLLRSTLPDRLPADTPGAPHHLDERDELAWLYGRLTAPDLPVLAPWS